ncbi:MAG: HlyD family efflux transporter periplasmic adaptor subunit [Myxococcales bacterium]|nr:HlyD family efflux transporter periplasmic adaptor subunit [Myxococcales bacterium]MCB9712978.1 HlyD family efflux transporter periplasmic adaptor subunit [Myxococcales bacterium]
MVRSLAWGLGLGLAPAGLLACESSEVESLPGFQGIVEYEERTLAFEVPGRMHQLAVEEGMLLAKGDVIGRLDDTLERLGRDGQAAQAKAVRKQLALIEAGSRPEDIKQLRASLKAARSAEELADRTFVREQGLTDKGIGRDADLDAATSAKTAATAKRQEIEQSLARARHGAREEEIEVAEAQAEAAEAAVKAADARIARHVLHSEHEGHVLEVHREEGEFVGIGTPIVTMADLARPYVDVFVPEARLGEVTLGAPAVIRIDASESPFEGAVETIGRRTEFTPKFLFSERERPNLVIRVRVRAKDPEQRLRAGLPAFVTFDAVPLDD